MICYRDRTYCAADCANDQCGIRLTAEIIQAAYESCLPVSQDDFSGTCEIYKPTAEEVPL